MSGRVPLTSPIPSTERAQRIARRAQRRRRAQVLVALLVVFVVVVVGFSALFHELMEMEGRSYSWPSSIYWTLTTMTTLGFGDITFQSDAGRIFSVVVLLTGSAFVLVMLPFIFIQFVFIPWMAEREQRRAPKSLQARTTGHILITAWGPVEAALVERTETAGVPYVIVVEDVVEAGRLHDEGRNVIVGALDDPETYRNARIEEAAMIVASRSDPANTNIAFTVREIAPDVTIVATANSPASVDILEIAGADRVVQLGEILGSAMAARSLGLGGRTHAIGRFGELLIAEAGIVGTDLVGQTLAEARLRARLGIGIVGVWRRGNFEIATADTKLDPSTILLLAGSKKQLMAFDERHAAGVDDALSAVIIGGGRVGRAIGRAYGEAGIDYTIVEKLPERRREGVPYVIGDAADREVLEHAGIDEAEAVVVTTHEDDVNVYLTRYCRGLRPEARIVSRARLDRNVSTLYRAGADAVLSYAATGSTAIWNHFRGGETVLVAEGLSVMRTQVPPGLMGRTLAETHVHRRTGCNVVAIETASGTTTTPDPHQPLPDDGIMIIVGSDESFSRFRELFPEG
ncbi:MAG TPA: NAD-binding protein [Acidimicrobiia bacterium]|nr:NAD-binding protein [Acidimicrobiia bacterium]